MLNNINNVSYVDLDGFYVKTAVIETYYLKRGGTLYCVINKLDKNICLIENMSTGEFVEFDFVIRREKFDNYIIIM